MNGETTQTDAGEIARRLGVSEELVRRLQARGVLRRFDVADAEIRRLLHDAHVRAAHDDRQLRLPRREVNTMNGRLSLFLLGIATAIATAAVAAGSVSAYPVDVEGNRLVASTTSTTTTTATTAKATTKRRTVRPKPPLMP